MCALRPLSEEQRFEDVMRRDEIPTCTRLGECAEEHSREQTRC